MLKPDSNGFEDLVNEYLNTPSSCDGSGLKFMQLKRLDRIADALEGIDSSLKEMSGSLEELTDCIGTHRRGGLRKKVTTSYVFAVMSIPGTNSKNAL